MKKLFKNLAVVALVLGLCSFNAVKGVPCDHQHDSECGYSVETDTGCTHVHEDIPTTLDEHYPPMG